MSTTTLQASAILLSLRQKLAVQSRGAGRKSAVYFRTSRLRLSKPYLQARHNSSTTSTGSSPKRNNTQATTPPRTQPSDSSAQPSSRATSASTYSSATAAPFASSLSSAASSTTTALSSHSPHWLRFTGRKVLVPLQAYGHAAKTRPNTTQLLSSLVIYAIGDLISQYIRQPLPPEPTQEDPEPAAPSFYEYWHGYRTCRSLFIGGVASLPAYHYFLWLSAVRIPGGLSFFPSLLVKVFINQLTFAPIINTWFFSMHALLTTPKHTLEQPAEALAMTWERVKETVPGTWLMGCQVWPVVTAVNFSVVDVKYRSIVAGLVAVGWQGYLGWVDLRAREAERARSTGPTKSDPSTVVE